eukprot:scaffold2188_cov388-Prasinococcus_capsulatus_cf.AAC.8
MPIRAAQACRPYALDNKAIEARLRARAIALRGAAVAVLVLAVRQMPERIAVYHTAVATVPVTFAACASCLYRPRPLKGRVHTTSLRRIRQLVHEHNRPRQLSSRLSVLQGG